MNDPEMHVNINILHNLLTTNEKKLNFHFLLNNVCHFVTLNFENNSECENEIFFYGGF